MHQHDAMIICIYIMKANIFAHAAWRKLFFVTADAALA